jgi:cytochrome c oxidase cbb3-type subunit III
MKVKNWLMVVGLLPAFILISGVAQATERGEDIYKTYCTQCHGSQGDGKGINTRDMSVQPRDHSDPKAMSQRSDQDLTKAIKEGGLAINKSVLMPPWGGVLTDEEVTEVVQYLRTLCKCSYGH